MWIDTHCHLDAAEFDEDRDAVVARARAAGVSQVVIPAVAAWNFDTVRELAHRHGFAYALGIHPLYVMSATDEDLTRLDEALHAHRDDPRLVGIGEIGLDFFVKELDAARQQHVYLAQLKLAKRHNLPVILHVRRSADQLLAGLRRVGLTTGGIGHAFNGSRQQAQAFIDLGFRLGFGGTVTFDRSLQIRRLAAELPADALVTETDAPDIPPQWLYKTAEERAQGATMRNEPAELPRIGASLAALRGWTEDETRAVTHRNALAALPRLAGLAERTVPDLVASEGLQTSGSAGDPATEVTPPSLAPRHA
ncbi:TatD family hydrolase [Roseateles amylovorans]|uniref:TatD family hydrolase n=1 Tax=Roseateles amylovorans TaxID=2978473 RepID=A0ABY6B3Q4_9BURK|nr:TatD family hydrolase [Roseateles amylovorans]UXH79692.1 TatD family hydrolase [Roseateles amylovorans]